MSRAALIVHGHFYQPPRENPWTEEVPREPSAAPFHDWNERIALESYRPNAFARVFDDDGRVVAIVNNYAHLSFDAGPTLLSWLEQGAPDAYARLLAADGERAGGMAQAYFHMILPLATERDVRTMVRWGRAEFSARFGRPADGLWLPETGVNDAVLAVLAEEGVRFTVLAPAQAAAVRRPDGGDWTPVTAATLDTRRAYRWSHPAGDGRGVDIVFYDGALSHAIAFELSTLSSAGFVDRAEAAAGPAGGLVAVAADGESFGHHHTFAERMLAYALAVEAPQRGIDVTTPAEWLGAHPPDHQVQVHESSWSCTHGVGRWKEDCGCRTGGQPGWNQAWRAPLRAALDIVAGEVDGVYERRGAGVFRDPWAARDAYIDLLLGRRTREEFAADHVAGDVVEALTLLEAQRNRLAMYTSCGWFFNDLAGLETVQLLRYAARAMDCLAELGEEPPRERVLEMLATARSNVAEEGDGRQVWARHVEPVRVDAPRVVAHLALSELLESRAPAPAVAAFAVEVGDHGHLDRGALALACGQATVTHRRTGRRTHHVYAALHLGGLEVVGATRPARHGGEGGGHGDGDRADLEEVRAAFTSGAPLSVMVRLVTDRFGPYEFGLGSALPDTAEQLLRGRVRALTDRFAAAFDRLFSDHQELITGLAAAGYPLPAELRAPAELALGRRLEQEVTARGGSLDPADYGQAMAIGRQAQAAGVSLDNHRARSIAERLLLAGVEAAIADPTAAARAVTGLAMMAELGIHPSLERAQELVYEARQAGDGRPDLAELAAALNLAV